MLGDFLLREHHSEEALVEYRTALKLRPDRLNGLRSAAEVAHEAATTTKRAGRSWPPHASSS
jgi:cytochrome c-type biogenesis protein CcmH/NrfG